jgi:hypothetical protein
MISERTCVPLVGELKQNLSTKKSNVMNQFLSKYPGGKIGATLSCVICVAFPFRERAYDIRQGAYSRTLRCTKCHTADASIPHLLHHAKNLIYLFQVLCVQLIASESDGGHGHGTSGL